MNNRKILIVSCMVLYTLSYPSFADSANVGNIRWSYRVYNDEAWLTTQTANQGTISDSVIGEVTIPSLLGGKPVTRLGNYSFAHCKISKVIFPNTK